MLRTSVRRSNGKTEESSHVASRRGSLRKRRKDYVVRPTQFLLGGNVNDPLNLAALSEDMNQRTPVHSPLPTPAHKKEIEVLIPADLQDPLRLNHTQHGEEGPSRNGLLLCRPMSKSRKHRKRRRADSDSSVLLREGASAPPLPEPVNKRARASPPPHDGASTNRSSPAGGFTRRAPSSRQAALKAAASLERHRPLARRNSAGELPSALVTCVAQAKSTIAPITKSNEPITRPNKPQASVTSNCNNRKAGQSSQNAKPPNKPKSEQRVFPYGNYNRYYGYRNSTCSQDIRLQLLRAEWFTGAHVLDIGCNVGHLTLAIAREFRPLSIIGVDIDAQLIRAAKTNIRNFKPPTNSAARSVASPLRAQTASNCAPASSATGDHDQTIVHTVASPGNVITVGDEPSNDLEKKHEPSNSENERSAPSGAVRAPGVFPQNVRFYSGNYVLLNDQLLAQQNAEYDTIMCMSVTKWVHLNWGDEGLKRMFKRAYLQLRPGGRFVLEPQPWYSYGKKKALTVSILLTD